MIDWHSHVLPAVDDGSKDVDESLKLLKLLHEQGVSQVVATPHFYANDETLDKFLLRRKRSYDNLMSEWAQKTPCIFLGAEVKYYAGISHLDGIDKLCIEGTNILLLEMPFCKWSASMVNELLEFANTTRLTIMLAHIERYYSMQDKSVWRKLYENGILMQVNASAFGHWNKRRKILKFLKSGGFLFVGSDCHNMTSRPPHIDQAFVTLEKKLGKAYYSQIQECWFSVLS